VPAVADTGNGVSAVLDFSRFLFINVDLSVHLHPMPIGRALQTLLIRKR
jgi:hypothetical protein